MNCETIANNRGFVRQLPQKVWFCEIYSNWCNGVNWRYQVTKVLKQNCSQIFFFEDATVDPRDSIRRKNWPRLKEELGPKTDTMHGLLKESHAKDLDKEHT